MALLLNILWNVPGLGFIPALMWLVASAIMALTIIGLPWARACLMMAGYSLLPFGNTLGLAVPGASGDGDRLRRHHYRPAFRLGASEAGGGLPVPGRQACGAE
jgi:hypothetical protein